MPTVYVSQLPHRRDPGTGTYVPAYNIGPAVEHGKIRVLCPPQAPFTDAGQIVPQLRVALKTYNCAKGDCLLLLGDPVVMAAVCALVSDKGEFRVLRWDRNVGRYVPVIVSAKLAAA